MKFLIADDDNDDAELFAEALQAVDRSVVLTVVGNGLQALEKLKSDPAQDLIFLDINMPEMNGWQCLEVIKHDTKLKDVPTIIYSTSSSHRDFEHAAKLGADLFFVKPDRYSKLKLSLQQVVSAVGEKTLRNLKRSFVLHTGRGSE